MQAGNQGFVHSAPGFPRTVRATPCCGFGVCRAELAPEASRWVLQMLQTLRALLQEELAATGRRQVALELRHGATKHLALVGHFLLNPIAAEIWRLAETEEDDLLLLAAPGEGIDAMCAHMETEEQLFRRLARGPHGQATEWEWWILTTTHLCCAVRVTARRRFERRTALGATAEESAALRAFQALFPSDTARPARQPRARAADVDDGESRETELGLGALSEASVSIEPCAEESAEEEELLGSPTRVSEECMSEAEAEDGAGPPPSPVDVPAQPPAVLPAGLPGGPGGQAAAAAAEAEGGLRAARGSRAVQWGCFQIAAIYLHGEHVGFGATCGRHLDTVRASDTQCKKSVRWGLEGLAPDQCVLRLKRWCLAGFEQEAHWGDCTRTRHVALGGAGLRAFADGPGEAELDELLAMHLQG